MNSILESSILSVMKIEILSRSKKPVIPEGLEVDEEVVEIELFVL